MGRWPCCVWRWPWALSCAAVIAYFAALVVVGLLAVTAVGGLVVGFSGLLPGLVRLVLIAICLKWLMDVAPAFEWLTRRYSSDIDPDPKTDLDFYDQGSRYWDMGMWAKTAAHWQVASRLMPTKVEYHTALAKTYVKLDYMAAALAEADRALAQAPDDKQLRSFSRLAGKAHHSSLTDDG